jgi:hypothetical protein
MEFCNLSSHAASALAGTGLGSQGPVNIGANSTILSDPHNPQRPVEVEIISQAWQYTALSTGIETSPGSGLIMTTLRIGPPARNSDCSESAQATDRAASSSSSVTSVRRDSSVEMFAIDWTWSLSITAPKDPSPICSARECAF